jgi:hypothetical protein
VFKLADIREIATSQVFDKDEKKIYATMLAMPNQRMTPTDKPVVSSRNAPADAPGGEGLSATLETRLATSSSIRSRRR